MKSSLKSDKMKYLTPKQVMYEGERSIHLPQEEEKQECYYVYDGYRLSAIVQQPREAVSKADALSGKVLDENGKPIMVGDDGIHPYGDEDRQILGHSNPNWILGLNNTFQYKDFDLSFFVMGRFGQTITSSLLGYYTAENSVTTNQVSGADYWTEDNQGAYYPRPGTAASQSKVYSSLRVVDGSFVKVKNITLGYTLPRNLTRKALVERLRIYATAYNPWIIVNDSKLKGTDPETGGADAFPTYKQFVFGVNLTF